MIKSSLFILSLALPAAAGEIKVAYPYEGMQVPYVQKTFIFGSVTPATAPFFINGERVRPHTNGGFIAYLPVTEGDFSFNCELREGATAYATSFLARKIKVRARPAGPVPREGAPPLEIISPSSDLELSPGDFLNVHAVGEPGKEVTFALGGLLRDERMTEIPSGSGRYYGSYRIGDGDEGKGLVLSARFKGGLLRHGGKDSAAIKVSILRKFALVETSTDSVNLRSAEDGGYVMFLPKGVRLASSGRSGGMRRIWLTPSESAWVEESKVSPAGSGPPPQTKTGTVRLRQNGAGSSALVSVYEKVPYSVEQLGDILRLKLYYTRLHTNWVVYDSSDTLVGRVSMRQGGGYCELDFELRKPLWGYDVSYGPKGLQLDMKGPPEPSRAWPRPLAGLKVVLDPGHSPKNEPPYDGAIGPLGTFEYQVNLEIGRALRDRLLELGAEVFMTRLSTETVGLTDRPKMAVAWGGDLFLSLHNNAIADGEDPFGAPRGFSIYHYHPHSFMLASAVQRSFLRNVPLPDEGLRFGDYHVVRMTQMPAILIEHAYMIMPEQEELLNTPAFRRRLADAVTDGLLAFLEVPPRPQPQPKKKKGKR